MVQKQLTACVELMEHNEGARRRPRQQGEKIRVLTDGETEPLGR